MLCYISSGVTPDIAYDRDDLAKPLGDKLRSALGDRGGSQLVTLIFQEDEKDLRRQFEGCASHIAGIFESIQGDFNG